MLIFFQMFSLVPVIMCSSGWKKIYKWHDVVRQLASCVGKGVVFILYIVSIFHHETFSVIQNILNNIIMKFHWTITWRFYGWPTYEKEYHEWNMGWWYQKYTYTSSYIKTACTHVQLCKKCICYTNYKHINE